MNANEARKISNNNGREEKIKIAIKQVEERIKESAKEGNNFCCYGLKECYGGESFYINGKYEKLPEVREHFIRKGFEFKDTGYIGGVYQHTERIYW